MGNDENGGVFEYDGSEWHNYTTANSLLNNNSINAIHVDSSGTVWFGTFRGVSSFDGSNWTQQVIDDFWATKIYAIGSESNGAMWFGTIDGAYKYSYGTLTLYQVADGLAGMVQAIAIDQSGNKWFGTYENGVHKFDGSAWTTYKTPVNLVSNYVSAIAFNPNGDIWFGTLNGGASRLSGSTWTHDDIVPNIQPSIKGMAFDQAALWGVDGSSTLYKFNGTAWAKLTNSDGIPSTSYYAVIADGVGNLWFGTSNGLIRYDGANWSYQNDPTTPFTHETVSALAVDADNHIWAAYGSNMTYNGAAHFDGNAWAYYTTAEGLASNTVYDIAIGPDGAVWFATSGGLSKLKNGDWTTYNNTNGLPGDVRIVRVDGKGNVWAAGGLSNYPWRWLARYDGNTWTSFGTEDGLLSVFINTISIDPQGHPWFGTNTGVAAFLPGYLIYLPSIRK
jgi:ligand-binding sensor domain-containing protein